MKVSRADIAIPLSAEICAEVKGLIFLYSHDREAVSVPEFKTCLIDVKVVLYNRFTVEYVDFLMNCVQKIFINFLTSHKTFSSS